MFIPMNKSIDLIIQLRYQKINLLLHPKAAISQVIQADIKSPCLT